MINASDRKEVYNQAKERYPERWSKETRDWSFSEEEWLNPKQEKETKTKAKVSWHLKKGNLGRVTTTQKNSGKTDDKENF